MPIFSGMAHERSSSRRTGIGKRDRRALDIRMRSVSSRGVAAAGYDSGRQVLRLRYVTGGTYDYLGVPPGVFQNFLAATSKGQFANWQIKPYYRYRRVD